MHTTRKTRETQLGQRFSSFFTVAVNIINNKGIIVTTRNSNNSWDKQPAAGEKRSRRNYIITTSVRMCAGLADACGCCAKFGGFGSLPFLFFFSFLVQSFRLSIQISNADPNIENVVSGVVKMKQENKKETREMTAERTKNELQLENSFNLVL